MEVGRNSVSKHQIQLEHRDEQADAGRDCRSSRETKFSGAQTGTRIKNVFPVQLTTSRIGSLSRLILTPAMCYDHTVPLYGLHFFLQILGVINLDIAINSTSASGHGQYRRCRRRCKRYQYR